MPKKKGHAHGAKAERVAPTAQTVVKLQPNYLWDLEPQWQQAAIGIAAGYRIIAGKLLPKSLRLATRSDDSPDAEVIKQSPIPREQQLEEIERRYNKWRERVVNARLPLPDLLDMIVDGKAPWRLDRAHGWAEGRAAEYLVAAVTLYGRE